MVNIRRRYNAQEKAKIVLEAIKGEMTQSQITAKYGVHGSQVYSWKKQALGAIASSFSSKQEKQARDKDELIEELYQQIGQLKVELDWLKKKQNCSVEARLRLVDFNGALSIRRQCELLGISRSGLYCKPAKVDATSLQLMKLIDEEYTRHPFYGTRRIRVYLQNQGYNVNRKRIQRLYGLMGLEAIYQKPRLSNGVKEHKKYPYLLGGVEVNRQNQVWSSDITFIRLKHGFLYLVAIIDWFSRYVLDWELSISLGADFCIETLGRVLKAGRCDIFNTDQGSQFTSAGFTGLLLSNDIKISMDGKGRALDNVFIERLWRSVKYENVYLSQWETVQEARLGLGDYFRFYNHERPHQSLGYKTPWMVYGGEG